MARVESAPARAGAGKRMTYEEFLDWCDEDTWAEWVDGAVIVLSPATVRHQDLVGLLFVLLSFFAERHTLGKVLCAPFQMRLVRQRTGRWALHMNRVLDLPASGFRGIDVAQGIGGVSARPPRRYFIGS